MRRTGTKASALVMILLGACDPNGRARIDGHDAPANATGAVSTAGEAPGRGAPAADVVDWLRGASVTDTSFERVVLYSWTTAETAARIRRTGEIFDDNQLPEGPTAYVRWLEHVASRSDPSGRLARALLGHPDLRRRRYAWHRPFATRLGLGARDYGDQLIRVELDPRALVGRFDPENREPWTFRDLDGRPVPLARALAEPGHIGAILHVRQGSGDEPRYREYVICNESMIASWSLATPAIAAAIAQDVEKLRALSAAAPLEGELGRSYAEVLAFEVPRYQPTRENLEAAVRAMEGARQEGAALIVRPKKKFDAGAAPGLVNTRALPPRVMPVIA